MHLPMAVRSLSDCVVNRIGSSLGKPNYMVCFQIRFPLLIVKRGWLQTQFTFPVCQTLCVLRNKWVTRIFF